MDLFVAKGIGICLFVSTGLVLTIAAITQTADSIYIYAESQSLSDVPTEAITDKNYGCVFDKRNYACELFDAEAFNLKNQWAISLTNSPDNKTKVKNDELQKPNNIYKIKISDYIGDWTNQGKFDKNISIVSKKNVVKKYAELKPLFALDIRQKPHRYTVTKYFVGKAEKPISNFQDHTTNKCSFGKETLSGKTEACKVYLFAASETPNDATTTFSSAAFIKTTTSNTNIETHKHYLIEFPKYISWNYLENQQINSVNYGKDENSKTIFSTITPVVLGSQDNKIFILPKN